MYPTLTIFSHKKWRRFSIIEFSRWISTRASFVRGEPSICPIRRRCICRKGGSGTPRRAARPIAFRHALCGAPHLGPFFIYSHILFVNFLSSTVASMFVFFFLIDFCFRVRSDSCGSSSPLVSSDSPIVGSGFRSNSPANSEGSAAGYGPDAAQNLADVFVGIIRSSIFF